MSYSPEGNIEQGPEQTTEAKLDESAIVPIGQAAEGVSAEELSGFGYTYRHNWGLHNGFVRLNLTSPTFTANTRAFVAVSEGPTASGGKFVGSARYLVYNVAPENGVISVLVHIDWASPIGVVVDYFIARP